MPDASLGRVFASVFPPSLSVYKTRKFDRPLYDPWRKNGRARLTCKLAFITRISRTRDGDRDFHRDPITIDRSPRWEHAPNYAIIETVRFLLNKDRRRRVYLHKFGEFHRNRQLGLDSVFGFGGVNLRLMCKFVESNLSIFFLFLSSRKSIDSVMKNISRFTFTCVFYIW